MGIVYKLKPEIKDFILEQKRANAVLSCRGLMLLVETKFQTKVSKSSINSIIKQSGLSLPVGRRPKKRRRKQEIQLKQIEFKPEAPLEAPAEIKQETEILVETPSESQTTGAILLKAADCLVGGSYYITEAAKNRLNQEGKEFLANTAGLIYLPLFGLQKEAPNQNISELAALVGKKISLEGILSYRNDLQSVKTIVLDMIRVISNTLQQVRCIKVNLIDGSIFYLDGQLHTVWSTPHIPYDFSSTIYNIKAYINQYFYEDKPIILFMAPGYDTPTREFFYFIMSLDRAEKKITKLTLYGNKFEELEIIPIEKVKTRFFVFGVWAWQFVDCRKVNKIGEFKPFYFEPLKKEFFVADIEIELSQPIDEQLVTLRGCALKTSLNEKTRLIILSNLPTDAVKPEGLADMYLNQWPNLEEAFQDYSAKIELFTYTGSSQRFFSTESLNFDKEREENINTLFGLYLSALDLYVKWHFLPLGHENKDFPTVNEHFYSLKVNLKREKDYYLATFQPPQAYPFLKELEYACRRVNEQAIIDAEGKRLWLMPYKNL